MDSVIINVKVSTKESENLSNRTAQANTEDMAMPTIGMPARFRRANTFGNNPSSAAAIGNSPWIKSQPFKAPRVAMTAAPATIGRAASPQNAPAASANGALLSANTSGGNAPMTAKEPSK